MNEWQKGNRKQAEWGGWRVKMAGEAYNMPPLS